MAQLCQKCRKICPTNLTISNVDMNRLHYRTCSCTRCTFSTLRYDKLKEHLHKQHKVGSAPERRVRITDLVNLDSAEPLESSVTQPGPNSGHQQSLSASIAPVLGHPVLSVVEPDGNECLEMLQTVIEGSAIVANPVVSTCLAYDH